MSPFAEYLGKQLLQRGINDMPVADRGYPGVGISSPTHTSYYTIPLYNELLRDRCKFTVLLPWVNDLSSGLDPAFSAADHTAKLADMARRLVANNPRGRILILNYYPGSPAPFSKNMAYGFTPIAIQYFNEQMARSCKEGELSKIAQVSCIDSNSVFATLGTAYVVGPMSRQEVEAFNTRPLEPQEQKDLDYYVRVNPAQPLIGDGIHLSSLGKTVLAAELVDIMLTLPDITG
jgi:lysophospholipase L1-like esterase